MSSFSRRQLASYAADELLANQPIKQLADNLVATLASGGRLKETEQLLADIEQELEDRGLLAKAKITAAQPLTADLRDELSAALKTAAGVQDILIEEQIDKAVIGGLKIETANHTWDKTIKRMLSDLKGTPNG